VTQTRWNRRSADEPDCAVAHLDRKCLQRSSAGRAFTTPASGLNAPWGPAPSRRYRRRTAPRATGTAGIHRRSRVRFAQRREAEAGVGRVLRHPAALAAALSERARTHGSGLGGCRAVGGDAGARLAFPRSCPGRRSSGCLGRVTGRALSVRVISRFSCCSRGLVCAQSRYRGLSSRICTGGPGRSRSTARAISAAVCRCRVTSARPRSAIWCCVVAA
jgi:hypothetical protein